MMGVSELGSVWYLRKSFVRRSFDTYRWFEHRVIPSIEVPPGGFELGKIYDHVVVSEPFVAITFDDGPHPENTPRLLDVLAQRNIKATFYVIGNNASRHRDILSRIVTEGHEVGNHTWSHRFLTTQTSKSILRELRSTDDVISEVTGHSPATFRPPYGAVTGPLSGWLAHEFGYATILWSVDAKDWESPTPEIITDRLVSSTIDGSIILAHDLVAAAVDAMPETLDRLLDHGFRFATVSELISRGSGAG